MPVSSDEFINSPDYIKAYKAPEITKEPTIGDRAGVGFRALAAIPRNIVAGTIGAVQGQSGVEAPGQGDVFEEYKRGVEQQNLIEQQAVAKQFPESTAMQTLSRLPQQVGFSAPATIAGISAGVLSAPATPATGGAGPFVAGGAAAGAVAYRASANQIMTSYIDTLDEQKREKSGVGLTPEETEAAKADFETKATEYGLWEAIPEAIGSAVGGRLVFGPIKSLFGRKVAQGMVKKLGMAAGAVAGTAAEELATETITQIGQNKTLQGTAVADPTSLDWTPEDAATALGQVAPDTLLLAALTGGLIKGGQLVKGARAESKLAKKLGISRTELKTRIQELAAYKAANPDEGISDEEMYSFLAGAVTVGEKPVEAAVEPVQETAAAPVEEAPPLPETGIPVTDQVQAEEPTQPTLVLSAFGKPFKTEAAALRSKTGRSVADTHELVPVEDGFAFAPKPVTEEAPVDLSTVQQKSSQEQEKMPDVRPTEERVQEIVEPIASAKELEDATRQAQVQEGVPGEYAGADGGVQAQRLDRVVTPEVGERGAEAGVSDIPRDQGGAQAEEKVTSELPRLKRGYKREIFTIDKPGYANYTFIEDTSTKGQKTLLVRNKEGGTEQPSKYIAEQVPKANRIPVEAVTPASPVDVLIKDIETKTGQTLKPGMITETTPPKGAEQTFTALGKLLNKKIVFFKAKKTPMAIHGATHVSTGTIFVNADSVKPHMVVVGHEFLHNLRREEPGLYHGLKSAVFDSIDTTERLDYWKKINEKRHAEGAQPMDLSAVDEELVANFFGEQFSKRSFWKKLEESNPDIFESIVQRLIDFLENVKAAFTGKERADAQRAQDMAVKALAKYVERIAPKDVNTQAVEYSDDLTKTTKKNIKDASSIISKGVTYLRTLQPGTTRKVVTVAPMSAIVDGFGADMPGLADLEALQRRQTNVSAEISTVFGELAKKMKSKEAIQKVTKAAEINSTRQMAGQRALLEQDWVVESRRANQAEEVRKIQEKLLKTFGETGKIGNVTPTSQEHAEQVSGAAAKRMWAKESTEPSKKQQLEWAQTAWENSGLAEIFGETFEEAYNKAKTSYDAMSVDEQVTYLSAVDELRKIHVRMKNGIQAVIEDTMAGDTVEMNKLVKQLNDNFAQLKGNYWPISRFGEYTLEFTDQRGQRNAESFENSFARHRRMVELAKEGIDPTTFQKDYRNENNKISGQGREVLSSRLIAALEQKEMAGVDQTDEEEVKLVKERVASMAATINDAWLKLLPETSAAKNVIRRKTTLGWSQDMVRSFLTYGQSHGRKVAQLEVGRKIDKTLSDMADTITMRKQDGIDVTEERIILNDQRARHNAAGSEGIASSFLRGLGKYTIFHYMTSPSVALVQMGQVAVFTLPKMMAKYNVKGGLSSRDVSAALTTGLTKAFSQKYRRKAVTGDAKVMKIHEMMGALVTPELRAARKDPSLKLGEPVYTRAEINDIIKKEELTRYQKELLALAEAGSLNLLDVSTPHEVNDWAQGKDPDSVTNRVFNGMMVFMRESEKASRKATILASFDAATKTGKNFTGAMEDIKEVVDSSLFNPAFDAKGIAFRSDTMRVLFQLQTFRVITAFKMVGLFKQTLIRMKAGLTGKEATEVEKQATKEFIGIMGMSGLVAGTSGMLAMPIIFKLINAVLGTDDEPFDAEKEWKQWLTETLGETPAEVVTEGAGTLLGTALSRRMGLADIYGFSTDAPAHLHGKGAADWYLAQAAGPTYSVASSWAKAYDQIANEGEVVKGLTSALPKPFRDALKAYQLAADGLKAGDKRLLAAEDITVNEIFLTAMGVQPLRTSTLTTREYAIKTLGARLSERFGQLVQDYVKQEGDKTSERNAIRAFMRKHPGYIENAGGRIRAALRKAAIGEAGVASRSYLRAEREYNK